MLYRLATRVLIPKKSRPVLPPSPVLPASAAAELSAVFGGVAISGAALYGLAMMIRDANGFDKRDQDLLAERMGLTTAATVQVSAPAEVAKTTDTADIVARVEEARTWISTWKTKSADAHEDKRNEALEKERREAEEVRARQEKEAVEAKRREEAVEAERIAREAEEKAIAAKKRVEAKEAELAAAMAEAEKDVQKRAQDARSWIGAWKETTATRESLAPNPELAAAVIKEMTEDTPVGLKKSPSPEPVLANVSSSATATEMENQKSAVRRVSITSEYESKIKSLISDYESSKRKREAMMMPKQTVTVAQEELAAAEQEQASRKTNPVVLFFLRIVALCQACFEFIKSFFTSSQGPNAQTA